LAAKNVPGRKIKVQFKKHIRGRSDPGSIFFVPSEPFAAISFPFLRWCYRMVAERLLAQLNNQAESCIANSIDAAPRQIAIHATRKALKRDSTLHVGLGRG
jgi:hypothetical protein